MKKIIVSLMAALMLFAAGSLKAQNTKLGHFSSAEIIQLMPEMDSAQKSMQDYAKELEDLIAGMQTEFQAKYVEFQNNQSQWSDLIKQTKTRELQDMQARVQEFAQQSEEDYQKKSQEIMAPIIEKINKAVREVAEDGKFTYIFDASNSTLYFGPGANDVTPQIKKKLGIPEEAVVKGK